jgi:uncharacterized protein involved in outer membrane biogenesis
MESKRRKRWLFAIGGIVTALALAVLAVVLLVDVNRYKPQFEAAASKALGLEVRILGDMKIAYLPPPGLTLAYLRAVRGEEDVLRVEKIRIGLKILPLFRGRIRLRELRITGPDLFIRRTSSGPFDYERYLLRPLRSARELLPGTFDSIDSISVTGGKTSYAAKDPADRASLEELDLSVRDIALQTESPDEPFRTISFAGTVKATRMTIGNAEASGIACGISAKDGNYEFDPVTLQAFGGKGEGSVWVYMTEAIPLVQVQYSLPGSRLETLFSAIGRKEAPLEGAVDISANLFMKGENPDAMAETLTGDLSWKGNDLPVPGFDPDALLSASGDRDKISLVRTGLLLLSVPPLAAASGKLAGPDRGMDLGTEKGLVRTLVSSWSVKNGVYEAKDVALATTSHRLALTGRIDMTAGRFEGITVALVDDKGCAISGQTIQGPFQGFVETALVTPKETVPGKACEVFYEGSVPPPE